MSSATTTQARPPRNGVDVPTLFATIDAVRAHPEAGQFRFRAVNRWVRGTHSRTTVDGFYGVGTEQRRTRAHTCDADHPEVLVGSDHAPTPVEHVLHGLAACLTAGVANIAAARGISLTKVESRLEGDIDLRGLLGLSGEVRNGYERIRVSFLIAGEASDDELRGVVEQSRARSAVFDIVTNGVPVAIDVHIA